MEFFYAEEGGRHCLRVPIEEKTARDSEIRMLLANRIPGIPETHLVSVDGEQFLSYDISGLESLKAEESAGQLPLYLRAVVFSIAEMSETLSDFLLTQEGLLLLPETIFLKEESGEVFFLYLPGQEGSVQAHLEAFTAWLISVLSPKEQEEILLLYGLYKKSREEHAALKTLREFWQHETGGEDFTLSAERTEDAPTPEEEDAMEELFGSFQDPEEEEEDAENSRETAPEAAAYGLSQDGEEDVLVPVHKKAPFSSRLKPYLFELVLVVLLLAAVLFFVLT